MTVILWLSRKRKTANQAAEKPAPCHSEGPVFPRNLLFLGRRKEKQIPRFTRFTVNGMTNSAFRQPEKAKKPSTGFFRCVTCFAEPLHSFEFSAASLKLQLDRWSIDRERISARQRPPIAANSLVDWTLPQPFSCASGQPMGKNRHDLAALETDTHGENPHGRPF